MEVSGHQESLDISIYQNNFLNISQMKESQTKNNKIYSGLPIIFRWFSRF